LRCFDVSKFSRPQIGETSEVNGISLSQIEFSSGKLSNNLCYPWTTNPSMSDVRNDLLTQLDFRLGTNGPDATWTKMLDI